MKRAPKSRKYFKLLPCVAFLFSFLSYSELKAQEEQPAQIAVVTVSAVNQLHATSFESAVQKTWPQNIGTNSKRGYLAADFNGDGPDDLACIDFDDNDIPRVFATLGPDRPDATTVQWDNGLRDADQSQLTFYFLSSDFNGDELGDIAALYTPRNGDAQDVRARIVHGPKGQVTTNNATDWTMTGQRNSAFIAGSFISNAILGVGAFAAGEASDIAAISDPGGANLTVRFYENPVGAHDPANNWSMPKVAGANPVAFRSGDFNSDGFLDIVSVYHTPANGKYTAVVVYGSNGTGQKSHDLGSEVFTGIIAADFNGDDATDLAGIKEVGSTRTAKIFFGSSSGLIDTNFEEWNLSSDGDPTGPVFAGKFVQSTLRVKALTSDGQPVSSITMDAGQYGSASTNSSGVAEIGLVFDGWTFTVTPTSNNPGPTGLGYHFQPLTIGGRMVGDTEVTFTAIPNVDTDSDGIFNHIDTDDDNDGLTDEFERQIGTNTLIADTDGDGVDDGQEIIDGSDPRDRGSKGPPLDRTLCSNWNGFLGGMWNVQEHVNKRNQELNVITTLFSQQGEPMGNVGFAIPPGGQVDILVHGIEGWREGAYGKVCSTSINGAKGDLDGRMIWYRIDEENSVPLTERFDFAFAMPFINGIKGEQFTMFNTFQPSLRDEDRDNLAANWIMINNLENSNQTGALTFYDQAGQVLRTQRIFLEANGRFDVGAHELGRSIVGLVAWRPDDSESKFLIRNARYFYDNPFVSDSFDTAYQFDGVVGSGQTIVSPLDATESSAILEIANTTNQNVVVDVNIHNRAGVERYSNSIALGPFATHHIIADSFFFNGEKGAATIRSSVSASVIATSMQYGRDADGGIVNIYGVQAKEPFGTVLHGNYHTYIHQECRLQVMNPTDNLVTASLTMTDSDGTVRIAGEELVLQPKGMIDYDLCANSPPSRTGTITLQPDTVNSIAAVIVRFGNFNDYRFPTAVRH